MNIRLVQSIAEFGAEGWRPFEDPDFPFLDYPFLLALETSGSIGPRTGWQPVYIACEEEGQLLGVLVSYVKQHSYGEYIFDWQWANFYQAHGEDYYPKLLTAVPFTPATGPRVLVRAGADGDLITNVLIASALEIAQRSELSSYHVLFLEERETEGFLREGFFSRHSMQYHWYNEGYRSFQQFLDALVGKRRRDITRERERVRAHGLKIERLTGQDLTEEHAAIMERFYRATTDKKNAIAYLQPGFFAEVFRTMPSRILLVLASKDGEPVAGALNFFKGGKLFGRHWGSLESYADLHFELCYYQTIDFAIERGLKLFEAGAQGEHKVQRGFKPSLTFSVHKIFDPRFSRPIEAYVKEEAAAIAEAMAAMTSPFKRPNPGHKDENHETVRSSP